MAAGRIAIEPQAVAAKGRGFLPATGQYRDPVGARQRASL
jgi:hypothetical protein